MISTLAWTLFILTAGLQYVQSDSAAVTSDGGPQEPNAQSPQFFIDPNPLFLTDYVDNCTYDEGREKSKVLFFQQFNVTAYSGFITVNKTAKSHLFFLMTEVEGNLSAAPLLLWTQGGPGLSALFGQFLENGPVAFDLYANYSPKFYRRMNSLQMNMSVIYLDLPVGAGFSYTEQSAYPQSMNDVTESVAEFMRQFLLLFPYYAEREFYVAGESYGARYSVAVADMMLRNSSKIPSLKLKGVIGGNGFLGPILDVADSSNFLYETSMLTEEGRQNFSNAFQMMKNFFTAGNYSVTLGLLFSTIFADITRAQPTLFQNLTLYNDHASPLYTERPFRLLACFKFLNDSSDFKKYIHVGENATFQYNNKLLLTMFSLDWLADISSSIENVLNETSVLFYTGQLDALFPSVNQRTYFASLNWSHAQEYRDVNRSLWKPYTEYYGEAGYIKKAHTFTEAVLLGMSHYGAIEKSDEVYFLIMQFIANNTATAPSLLPEENGSTITE